MNWKNILHRAVSSGTFTICTFTVNVKHRHHMEWLLMNGLPLFHLLISRVSIRFLTFIAWQRHKLINYNRITKRFNLYLPTLKKTSFSLFSPESQNMQIIIWGRKEREKACVKVFRNRIFRNTKYVAYDLFYIYNIMNIFLLWIYVGS